jgi:hypothetical protein
MTEPTSESLRYEKFPNPTKPEEELVKETLVEGAATLNQEFKDLSKKKKDQSMWRGVRKTIVRDTGKNIATSSSFEPQLPKTEIAMPPTEPPEKLEKPEETQPTETDEGNWRVDAGEAIAAAPKKSK